MGCLRFIAVISRQVPVALFVAGLLWIGQGLLTGRGPEGTDLEEALMGGGFLLIAGLVAVLPAWGLSRLLAAAEKRVEVPKVEPVSPDFTGRLEEVYTAYGYEVRPGMSLGEALARFLAVKRQWHFFLPARDWHYVFFVENGRHLGPKDVQKLNESARAHTIRHYRLPRTLRFDIPMTATILVSPNGFNYEAEAYVRGTLFFKAGDANDVYLLDLNREQILHSEKRPSSGYIPLERAYHEIVRFADLASKRRTDQS